MVCPPTSKQRFVDNGDGTVFTDLLARLNGIIAFSQRIEQLGGHSDWRLPTSAELQSILLEPSPCSEPPCIDPVFAPTQADWYWTSTSSTDNLGAWGVDFGSGFPVSGAVVGVVGKTSIVFARAVRGPIAR